MAYIENPRTDGVTRYGLEFFMKYKESFGNVVKVTMQAKPQKVDYTLTLENDMGEKMVFKDSFTSGYNGEGPRGTQRVLELCGFKVEKDYAATHTDFAIKNNNSKY